MSPKDTPQIPAFKPVSESQSTTRFTSTTGSIVEDENAHAEPAEHSEPIRRDYGT
jgi:hypothetical protein